MPDFQAIVDFILAYEWYAVLLGIGLLAFWLLRAYGRGILQAFQRAGEEDGVRLFKQVDLNDITRAYLEQASRAYSRFKFRGLPPRARKRDRTPATGPGICFGATDA